MATQGQAAAGSASESGGSPAALAAAAAAAAAFPATSLYVGDLHESVQDAQLFDVFSQVGGVVSVRVCRDINSRKSLGYAYVNYNNQGDAARALELLNFTPINGKPIRIMYSNRDPSSRKSGTGNIFIKKKSEREMELKEKFEKNVQEVAEKFQNTNLYLKNLEENIDDEKLRELFAEYGNITSCKVMRDSNGVSRGSGFVAFKSAEDANRALTEMNGKMVGSKPLYVALAQRKEDRKAKLQAQFSQMRPVAMAPSVGPRMPMFPPGVPGVGQQLFYGQPPPAFINPQAGFAFQQPLMPGMRPGGPMPNFMMPMVQQGQQPQRPAGRRAGGMQQPMPMGGQQQVFPRGGRGYRYPTGRGMPDPGMHSVGAVMPPSYEMGGMPMREAAPQPVPIGALATALANAPPDQQRLMLGENLYPLVEQLEREQAAKVTGMLLEMDQTEVLHLLESPDALKAKVAEAMEVLRSAQHLQQSNVSTEQQLANLSLNDGVVSS
ncbi:Polyadenylate-binding protein 8 [Zea mays]|uniref:Polyadenylate-binding protein 8 n=1 Tax=Zea mays TaxID=4577 RepID=A0A3L6G0H0_MAIZE|nr:Polyadenylate-binding protein 8 [Zea mays]